MSEEDKLFNFMSGLQSWAQAELRRQGIRDVPSAIAAAEGLVDFKMGTTSSMEKKKGGYGKKDGKKSDASCGEMKDGKKKDGRAKSSTEGKASSSNSGGCFLCGGPHRVRDCPKKEKLSALVADHPRGGDDEADEVMPRLNPL